MRSYKRLSVQVAMLALAAAASAESFSQNASPAGNPSRGKDRANTCLGCHGVPDYKNAYPNYRVPKLEGQHPEYIVIALQAYRAGERSHITMHSQASSLSNQDMADIAAYFAGVPLKSSNAPEGKAPAAAQVCVACHGVDGVGITPQYPTLAGQHEDYLVRALTEYKKGGRKNPVMATFAGQLNAQQMEDLAAYYSQQLPALKTEERPSTRLTVAAER
jgi:cytochrome c553